MIELQERRTCKRLCDTVKGIFKITNKGVYLKIDPYVFYQVRDKDGVEKEKRPEKRFGHRIIKILRI